MEVVLNWDLVLLGAMVVLFGYGFLLGQDSTVKLILSIYIAILTADGIAGLLKRFVLDASPGMQTLLGDNETQFFMVLRMTLFFLVVVIFVVKGGFHIRLGSHSHWAFRIGIHSVFAFLSALLFLSTFLIYLSGNSYTEGIMRASEISVYTDSAVAKLMIDGYQFWFSLPAIAFLVSSFLFEKPAD